MEGVIAKIGVKTKNEEPKLIRIGILGAGKVVKNRYTDVFNNEIRNAKVTVVC